MSHKEQHYIPRTYLKAWCDTNSPSDYEPYVWIYKKNGGDAKSKSPKSIFWETDFYTVKKINGERDLVLEHGLAQLETQFAKLRDKKLTKRKPLTFEDKSVLCTFVAAMHARTKSRRNHLKGQWQQVLDMGDKVTEWIKSASPDESNALHTPHGENPPLNMDDVKHIAENTIQSSLGTEISMIAPALFDMRFAILDTIGVSSFITSDNPCIWFDSDLYKKPPPLGAGGLNSPSIEISLPLSPTQYIIFGRKLLFSGLYVPIKTNNPLLNTLNRRTWAHSDEFFVSNQKLANFYWQI